MRIIKIILAAILSLGVTIALFELGASLILYHRYKNIDIFRLVFDYKPMAIFTIVDLVIPGRIANYRYELKPSKDTSTFVSSAPSPFWFKDEKQGFSTPPGRYIFNFHKGSIKLPTVVTILEDGSRFTGKAKLNVNANIYVFGDSFIFGQGVNDEQTFSALLQGSISSHNVHLYANGGYSHVNAFISINNLVDKLGVDDVVVIGYASFYKIRNVAAPSRLKEYGTPNKIFDSDNYPQHLKAIIDQSEKIKIEKISLYCAFNGNYCSEPDPSISEQNRVTVKLINAIAEKNPGTTILLVFEGEKDHQVFSKLNRKIKIVYARPEDFDYFMRDNVADFDGHPGPYWHYAIYDRLRTELNKN